MLPIKDQILKLEKILNTMPDTATNGDGTYPVEHYFHGGIYTRKISIPAGVLLTTYIHKKSHPTVLLTGKCFVYDEFNKQQELEAPQLIFTKAGTKRVIYVIEDCIWLTMHQTNKLTVEEAEKELSTLDYKEMDMEEV